MERDRELMQKEREQVESRKQGREYEDSDLKEKVNKLVNKLVQIQG